MILTVNNYFADALLRCGTATEHSGDALERMAQTTNIARDRQAQVLEKTLGSFYADSPIIEESNQD